MVMSVFPLVPEDGLKSSVRDWAKKKELDFLAKGRGGDVDAGCKRAFALIRAYLASRCTKSYCHGTIGRGFRHLERW